ncbi:MAG: response regulator [Proteobacteria bacterium]|nr:response regulator [Pseudomonadota bacterium]
MRYSLQHRYIASVLALMLGAVLTLGGVFFITQRSVTRSITHLSIDTMREVMLDQAKHRGAIMANLLANNLAAPLSLADIPSIHLIAVSALEQQDVQYFHVYNSQGELLEDGGGNAPNPDKRFAPPPASEHASAADIPLVDINNDSMDVFMPIYADNIYLGGVRVGFSLKTVNRELEERIATFHDLGHQKRDESLTMLTFFSACFIIVGVILAYFFAKYMSNPVLELAHYAKRIGQGDFGFRFSLNRRDELGLLSRTMNEMALQINEKNKALLDAHTMLEKRVVDRTRELMLAKNKAEAANRAKSNFLANMSHEIRTPMNGVIGMTQLALMASPRPEQREYLELIEKSSYRLLNVVNDILDFSKIEADKLNLTVQRFDLRDTIATTIREFSFKAQEKGLELDWHVQDEVPDAFMGDAGRLSQILINLIGNAIKFTPSGRISVGVRKEYAELDEFIAHFTITDTGIGISPEHQTSVFEAFSQADESHSRPYEGTGLGLAICAKLVALMNGRIWVESDEGKGSVFHFTALFKKAPQENSEQKKNAAHGQRDEAGQKQSGPQLEILLAEDNLVNQKVAQKMLERSGHRVTIAVNGQEAVAAFGRQPFDLVLMDIQMPIMDGFEATQAIRDLEKDSGKHTPIIALTAHAITGYREKCLERGLDDYLSKPMKIADLNAKIADHLPQKMSNPTETA